MKLVRIISLAFIGATLITAPASAYTSTRSYSSPRSYSAPRAYSAPKSTTPKTSATPKSTTPKTNYFNGPNYNISSQYVNWTGLIVAYWLVVHDSEGKTQYKCYDQDHKEISCNRQAKSVDHEGQKYFTSDAPYKNTDGKNVTYYQKKFDTNTGKVKYYMCFDKNFARTTCNRKK